MKKRDETRFLETTMTRNADSSFTDLLNRQGANALIQAALGFLRANDVPKDFILRSIRDYFDPGKSRPEIRHYRKLARAYEEMGIVLSTKGSGEMSVHIFAWTRLAKP